MNYMAHELTNNLIKLVMPESTPSKMPTPLSVVTMQSVANKIKELLTPEKTKAKLSPERVKVNNTTNTSHKEQTDKKLDAGKRKAKCCDTEKKTNQKQKQKQKQNKKTQRLQ